MRGKICRNCLDTFRPARSPTGRLTNPPAWTSRAI